MASNPKPILDAYAEVRGDGVEGLVVDRFVIPADGAEYLVARFGTAEPVYFVVNGMPELVTPEFGVAELGVSATAPGVIRIEVRDKTAVVVAEEVA